MTIATIGPKKYDFQDLVCLDFVLKTVEKKDISFLIEPHGGEDASFTYKGDNDGILKKFEVQVKGSEAPVTPKFVAECLLHFPEQRHENCLFERMIEDCNLCVVLVMSGRSTDKLLKYLPNGEWDLSPHKNNFTLKDAEALNLEFQSLIDSFGDTRLMKARKEHTQSIIENFNAKEVRDSLQRLIIIDNESEKLVKENIHLSLRSKYHIPDDYFEEVIRKSTEYIKTAKESQEDVIEKISQYLKSVSSVSLRPSNYIQRGDEDNLKNLLTSEHSLLLSGKPRIGKSYTAMWIAASFQDQGYRVKRTDDIFEAFRFLEDPVNGPRLVVVDDPLGGSRLSNNPQQIWQEIKSKLSFVPSPQRKIIISQGQERLLEISGKSQLEDIRVAAKCWNDLSSYPDCFLEKFWQQSNEREQLPEQLYLTVLKSLNNGLIDIELGSLEYLVTEREQLHSTSDVDEIIRFARKSSSDLGKSLDDEGHKSTLMSLALTTSGLSPIHETELSYVLQNTVDKQYGYSKILGSSFGGPKDPEVQLFPDYSNDTELPEEYLKSLDKLEEKKMTQWDDEDKISFTHPFYRAAAESIIKPDARSNWKQLKAHLSNGIFCLSPTTSKSTAKNLRWLYQSSSKQKFKEDIVDLAIAGLSSSYPSTRDVCFNTLLSIAPELKKEQLEQQTQWLSSVSFSSLSDANWHNGYPWYPMGHNILLNSDLLKSLGMFEVPEESTNILEGLNSTQFFDFTPKNAFDALNYCRKKPDALKTTAMMRILSLDEGQIRALAARIWLEVDRGEDIKVLNRIFDDKHPSVAEAIYETLISNWKNLSTTRRKDLINRLQLMVESPLASAIILPELLKFNRHEVTGNEPPWDIFYQLLPTVLNNAYKGISVNFPRLDRVVSDAISEHGYDRVVPILEAWVTLLETNSRMNEGGGYDVAVVNYMLDISEDYNLNRIDNLERLLKIPSTRHVINVLSLLVDSWSQITKEERGLVEKTLSANRADLVWIKSAVLIRPEIPAPLLKKLTNLNSTEITYDSLLKLDNELQEAALSLYMDSFVVYIPNNAVERTAWQSLIHAIVNNPDHPLYQQCFEATLSRRCNDAILAEAVAKTNANYLGRIFDILLSYAIKTTGEYRPLVWSKLFESAPYEEIKNSWLIKMAEKSSLYLDNIGEIKEWLPEIYIESFYSYMSVDSQLLSVFKALKDNQTNVTLEEIDVCIALIESCPPNHFTICEYAQKIIESFGETELHVERIKAIRETILKRRLEEIEAMGFSERQNWLY
ncbi:nSTAND3 domain-containing NTPase [Vibrio cholerae]|uniref:nSTAND3 domain-containing NTPase n=1 Tax=Vibrio cholerae TaxID=666 RepID=UPI003966FA7A